MPDSPVWHILASPGYARGTIAVNVTSMERGFNACQSLAACTHLSSTVYELWRDIGRKLQLFPTPLHLTPPLVVIPLDDLRDFLVGELPDDQATIRCKNIPEKLNPLSRVHACHRQT